MTPRPFQSRAVAAVLEAQRRGERRTLLTAPTGAGKTFIDVLLIREWVRMELPVVLYTNRLMLLDQLSRALAKACVPHGIRAAGYREQLDKPVQIASVQTELARFGKREGWPLHPATRVIVDEAHLHGGDGVGRILQAHLDAGALVLGQTATPLGLDGKYDSLLVAATVSECRAAGALVPAHHFGPDEPDLRKIGRVAFGTDLSEEQNRSVMMVPGLLARVLEWYETLNPTRSPTVLFAPGVKESIWFAEQFSDAGIPAAHVDGESVWRKGELVRNDRALRDAALNDLKTGKCKVLCNRFVLREGIDLPFVRHGILACVFGSLTSYLQACGRLLRAADGKTHATIQDHGGNWWRHGSVNDDRDWSLDLDDHIAAGLREDRLRNWQPGQPPEPACCPACKRILRGRSCVCGWKLPAGSAISRPVVQHDGTLFQHTGRIFKQRQLAPERTAGQDWQRCYYRALNAGMTFRQAEALFAKDHDWYYPPRTLPLMPTVEMDWFRRVQDVPRERLNP